MKADFDQFYEFGDFRLAPGERLLLRDGKPVPLAPKVFETLVMLVERSGRLVEKDDLMKEVWAEAFVEEANLARNIWTLRRALGDDDDEHKYIETVPKRGYRFVAPVTRSGDRNDGLLLQRRVTARIVTEEETSDAQSVVSIDAGESLERPRDAHMTVPAVVTSDALKPRPALIAGRTKSRTRLLAALAVFGLIGLAVLVAVVQSRRRSTAATRTVSSIAVIPFANVSGDPDLDYLSDGVTENIINELSPASELKIIALNSVFGYKGKEIDAREVGNAFGVQALLVGRVVQRGDQLSVSAELIDARDRSHIWGEHYDRKVSDLRFLQQDLARDITNSLRLHFTKAQGQAGAGRYTGDSEAYQNYLKGRYFWNKRTEAGLRTGIEYFEKSIARDSGYALAYAGLADSYIMLANWDFAPPAEAYKKARAAALRALELDAQLAEAKTSLAYTTLLYEWDWTGAEKGFREAIALNPNYASAHHFFSICLMTAGRQAEALAEIQRAQELDPLSLIIASVHGWICYEGRQFDCATNYYNKTLEMDSHYVPALLDLGTSYLRRGENQKAIDEFQKARAASGDTSAVLADLAQAYALSGQKTAAQNILARLERPSDSHYVSPWDLAFVYAALGYKTRAIQLLEKAAAEKVGWVILLGVEPAFDPLRTDPRFEKLKGYVGIPVRQS